MKAIRSFIISAFCLVQFAFAASANSAEAYQLGASTPNTFLAYVIYTYPDGSQVPQQPFQIPVSSLFVAMQTATEKPGKNGGASHSFNHLDKFGNSLVTSYRIEWVKDGVVRDTRTLSQWLETGKNWNFQATQKVGKNTNLIREGMVNDILQSPVGGSRAMFNDQYFTIDGAASYEVRIWTTVNGLPIFRQIPLPVQAWYQSVSF